MLKQIAKLAAARAGQPASKLYRALLQRLSVTVRTANARAYLRRMG